MGRPLRYVPAGSLVEVTTRTVHGRWLMRPSPEVNDVILGIVGRALEFYPVRIHAFVVLSNHAHWLLTVENAAQLAGFMNFVNGNIAREIGKLHRWRDRFWARRYRSIVVVDDDAAVGRLRYILRNGCKEGLVDRPRDWPGLSCSRALTSGGTFKGTWYDRSKTHKVGSTTNARNAVQFGREQHFRLSPLPCWSGLSPAQQRAICANAIADIEEETLQERAATGVPCVGAEAILAQDPHDNSELPDRSPAPAVHASTKAAAECFLDGYRAFLDAFRAAVVDLMQGKRAVFPEGAFPPRGPFVPPTAAAA